MILPELKTAIHLEVCESCRKKVFDLVRNASASPDGSWALEARARTPKDLCNECDAKVAQAVRILLSGHVMVKRAEMKKLDMRQLEEVREWVLGRRDRREGALFVFSWAVGVCSAAGLKVSELAETLIGPRSANSGKDPKQSKS